MERAVRGEESVATMGLDAGRLCLDFANTSNWHASDHPVEFLTGYDSLVTWAERTGNLTETEARQLLAEARRRPEAAAAALAQAIEVREAIYQIFDALVSGRVPEAEDMGILNRALSQAMTRAQIVATPDGFGWGWAGDDASLERVLWPVVRSAADLLASEDRRRIGQCADDRGCGWLFLDMSRNHSRRWCDMKDCGNRAKARRHYHKQRAVRAGA